jgi:hypothetical protein
MGDNVLRGLNLLLNILAARSSTDPVGDAAVVPVGRIAVRLEGEGPGLNGSISIRLAIPAAQRCLGIPVG